jgi:hypothetical protein
MRDLVLAVVCEGRRQMPGLDCVICWQQKFRAISAASLTAVNTDCRSSAPNEPQKSFGARIGGLGVLTATRGEANLTALRPAIFRPVNSPDRRSCSGAPPLC